MGSEDRLNLRGQTAPEDRHGPPKTDRGPEVSQVIMDGQGIKDRQSIKDGEGIKYRQGIKQRWRPQGQTWALRTDRGSEDRHSSRGKTGFRGQTGLLRTDRASFKWGILFQLS